MRRSQMRRSRFFVGALGLLAVGLIAGLVLTRSSLAAPLSDGQGSGSIFPAATQLRAALVAASSPTAGGLFNGARMWAAIVDRSGRLQVVTTSTTDPTQVWPGSQAIAKAKAYTANAFSLDSLPLSTAQLYTFTQPGH